MESVRRDIKLLRQPSPGPGHRRYVRIYSKKARSMLSPSSSTSYSRKGNRPSRPNTPSKSPRQGFPELSDVPCYTCRRRHVKCDRILPHWYGQQVSDSEARVNDSPTVPSVPKRELLAWDIVCTLHDTDQSPWKAWLTSSCREASEMGRWRGRSRKAQGKGATSS